MNIGRVVLVQYPWDDLSSTKGRPSLCLSEPRGDFRQLILAFIGSKIPPQLLDTDYVIEAADADFAGTGLLKSSLVRVHRLISISAGDIEKEIGVLSEMQMTEVDIRIARLFKRQHGPSRRDKG